MPTYTIAAAPHRLDDPALLARWQELLAASQSPERIYQSPAYFAFAQARGLAGTALFTVTAQASGELVGILPVLERWLSLEFPAGRQRGWRLTLPSVVLLGSVPLLPPDPLLWQQVCSFLLARYPRCQAISLNAVPAPAAPWRTVPALAYLLHGWRDCHTTPLPADYASFLAQLGSKRRYNIKRQLRLLEAHCGGALRLHRIVRAEQLAHLSAALSQLSSAAQRRQWLSDATLTALAQHGLLQAYVLDCGDQPAALLLALCDGATLHIQNILHDTALAQHSPGTAILFLAIEDACQQGLRRLDFGYGTPAHNYQSINQTQARGHLLVFRPSWRNRALYLAHRLWCAGAERLQAYLRP